MTEITEEQVDVLHTPVVEKDETEFAPIRTAETRALIARKKEQGWEDKQDIRGLVETRDILEFAAIRNMASAVQEASDRLAELPNLRGVLSRSG